MTPKFRSLPLSLLWALYCFDPPNFVIDSDLNPGRLGGQLAHPFAISFPSSFGVFQTQLRTQPVSFPPNKFGITFEKQKQKQSKTYEPDFRLVHSTGVTRPSYRVRYCAAGVSARVKVRV